MRYLFLTALGLLFTCCATAKIQDCPDEKIINKMPAAGEHSFPTEYYIYKGQRKELTDFDQEWIKKNCPNIPVQEVF